TCRMTQVESDVVVPVETASDKEEYAARTLRPRIHEHLDRFLVPVGETEPAYSSLELEPGGVSMEVVRALLDQIQISRDASAVNSFSGGASEARELLDRFIEDHLADYADRARDPNAGCTSHMSPYLHFGQISPIEIALKVQNADNCGEEAREAYLEQLIVRRELSMNFCFYNPQYDSLDCVPGWAQETLAEHADDEREYVYTREELEGAETHDPYWNAAQKRMMVTGKMESYMRMYWGKKILEWSRYPRTAFRTALELNNRYELDGRDPNGYAGVAWCFGKHDQGWAERRVYGKVRYMSASGLERKFDMDRYVEETRDLVENSGRA
ncbi:MAG: deoxyribodipyrimidine photolyase, partial [Planctomycetota bacterium]